MKSLNENWFLVTLVAVVFGLIGYLIGRTGNQQCQRNKANSHMMVKDVMEDAEVYVWKLDEGLTEFENDDVDIEIDSTIANGKKQIKVVVKKERKL